MQHNECIVLNIDMTTQGFQIAPIAGELNTVEKLYVHVATAISRAFDPVADTFVTLKNSIDDLNISIGNVATSLDLLLEQFNNDSWLNILSIADSSFSIMSSLVTLLGSGSGLFSSGLLLDLFREIGNAVGFLLGKLGSLLGISAGWVAAIIAVIGTAIVLTIAYWDEISLFFTEKLPSRFADFIKWLGTVTAPIGKALSPIAEEVSKVMQPCWEEITSAWSGLLDFISQVFIEPTEKN